ncbi:MAG: hypothetical protein ACT4NU_07275 [Chromatiales bacterium]
MADTNVIEISLGTAVKIADFLKEELRTLDLELERSKTSHVGATALNVMRNKRDILRAIYDELKAAGVEGYDSTVELFSQSRPPFRR